MCADSDGGGGSSWRCGGGGDGVRGEGFAGLAGDPGDGEEGESVEEDRGRDVGQTSVAEVFGDELDGEENKSGVGEAGELGAAEAGPGPGEREGGSADGEGS